MEPGHDQLDIWTQNGLARQGSYCMCQQQQQQLLLLPRRRQRQQAAAAASGSGSGDGGSGDGGSSSGGSSSGSNHYRLLPPPPQTQAPTPQRFINLGVEGRELSSQIRDPQSWETSLASLCIPIPEQHRNSFSFSKGLSQDQPRKSEPKPSGIFHSSLRSPHSSSP